MSYIKENFLLSNDRAIELYRQYAKDMPIFDYHCHLSEKELLADEELESIYAVWLKGDHYKWRLMRNYGVDEEYITGSASDKEKFLAYCKTVGTAFGNPLYHWSQCELEEYFDCKVEINEKNAEYIWNACNEYIKKHHIKPSDIIKKSKVKIIFTTNEVFDDLSTFTALKNKFKDFTVLPAFRADKIMNIEAEGYEGYVSRLAELTNPVSCLSQLETALEERLKAFIATGCKAADIALERVLPVCGKETAEKVFTKRLRGEKIDISQAEAFKGYLTYYLLKLYAAYDIAAEIHVGAMRNNNSVMLKKLGLDSGYDSISQENSTSNLSKLFDRLNSENLLPKIILFNLNPKMNAELVSLAGCFQSSAATGKIQYGAAWWFLDHKPGIEKQLSDLAGLSHIGTFIGMLTDSRSFLSYPRHQYFRRILCNFLGTLMENGEMTQDMPLAGDVVRNICYFNALSYFGMGE
jgi:glucuronate isomerase